jgi:predicted transposase YbfD/YdcC
MVRAFVAKNELTLGQLKIAGKGKELEGIKLIIQLLDLERTTLTIDAGGCHKEVAELIREKAGNYILGFKGNQGKWLAKVENFFAQTLAMNPSEWERECHIAPLESLKNGLNGHF